MGHSVQPLDARSTATEDRSAETAPVLQRDTGVGELFVRMERNAKALRQTIEQGRRFLASRGGPRHRSKQG